MATPAERRTLRVALRMDRADRRNLAQEFAEWKIRAYIDTLAELAETHGYTIDQDEIVLSDTVLRALTREARDHAAIVVDTFNTRVEQFIDRNKDRHPSEILDDYVAWSDERHDRHAETIAITEAYSAHVDATVAFWQATGHEPMFDFGGHGDPAARCDVCQALEETSPHPLARIREIGVVHIGCRQDVHPVGDLDATWMADEIELGTETGGIVGTEPLVNRNRNDHDAAAAEVRRLAAEPAEETSP